MALTVVHVTHSLDSGRTWGELEDQRATRRGHTVALDVDQVGLQRVVHRPVHPQPRQPAEFGV